MLKKSFALIIVAALPAIVVGCGGDAAGPKLVRVTGTVTFKGQTVQGALVTFSPTGAAGRRAAVGTTDASGRFNLTTINPGDGAMPGTYAVGISKTEAPQVAAGPEKFDPTQVGGTKDVPSKDLLPSKYKTASGSGLTAEVQDRGPNDFKFELKE